MGKGERGNMNRNSTRLAQKRGGRTNVCPVCLKGFSTREMILEHASRPHAMQAPVVTYGPNHVRGSGRRVRALFEGLLQRPSSQGQAKTRCRCSMGTCPGPADASSGGSCGVIPVLCLAGVCFRFPRFVFLAVSVHGTVCTGNWEVPPWCSPSCFGSGSDCRASRSVPPLLLFEFGFLQEWLLVASDAKKKIYIYIEREKI